MSSPISLRFVGDIFIQQEKPEEAVAGVLELTRPADVMVGNLEIPLCDTGHPQAKANGHLRAEPRQVAALVAAGFDSVSLANNHAMNYGVEGLGQTQAVLDGAGISHAGGGSSLASAHSPTVGEKDGWRWGMLSYTSVYARGMFEARPDRGGLATVQVDTLYEMRPRHFEVPGMPPIIRTRPLETDVQRLLDDIRTLRPQVDTLVVCWHWGVSLVSTDVVPYQRDLGRLVIDAGADIVVGHHPHVLQPLEFYGKGLICYSIGNFSHALRSNQFTPESAVLEVLVGSGGSPGTVRVYPTWLDAGADPTSLAMTDPRCESVGRQLGHGDTVVLEKNQAQGCFDVAPRVD